MHRHLHPALILHSTQTAPLSPFHRPRVRPRLFIHMPHAATSRPGAGDAPHWGMAEEPFQSSDGLRAQLRQMGKGGTTRGRHATIRPGARGCRDTAQKRRKHRTYQRHPVYTDTLMVRAGEHKAGRRGGRAARSSVGSWARRGRSAWAGCPRQRVRAGEGRSR
ncbi:hypothetical protein P154DRAFT_115227 [Amniculicola lignicola CBS 123094]|uniref:Uncharacterized protein n=1 Tax=Amniculicola lignicola CBS 123094 TaxID=1392246 RepID=A0A6A5WZF5_9PLEO|nr:hypothetical protein P154DRAFT_115227 [Amniculicola lignicola CBS 123094]